MGYVFDALNKLGKRLNEPPAEPPPASGDEAAPIRLGEHLAAASAKITDGDVDEMVGAEGALVTGGGKIPPVRSLPEGFDDRLVAATDASSIMGEEYRAIRTRLLARWQHRRHIIHTITSATPKEGKTLTSLNLGLSFSEMTDRRTIVVECDLRIPMFAKMLALPEGPGLIQVLRGEAELDDAIRPSVRPNLSVIAAGAIAPDDATQLLSSAEFSQVLTTLRERYDHVIVDTPPVLDLADAGIAGGQSDEVIVIVRMNRTPRYLVDEAIRTLNSYDAPVSGCVLTDMRLGSHGGYSYWYRGYYRHGYTHRYRYVSSPTHQALRRSA